MESAVRGMSGERCKQCGTPLPGTARFCPECGAVLRPTGSFADGAGGGDRTVGVAHARGCRCRSSGATTCWRASRGSSREALVARR